ncbi:MAG: hypothetical protein AAB527_02130 [Patescibacteria group bacterium]
MKYPDLDLGKVEAIVNRLGGMEGVERFLRTGKILPFERNEHGHITLSITGLALTGAEEVDRLTTAGFRVSKWAKSCLTSTRADGYDKNHRLVTGQDYRIALIPTREVECDSERTTENLRQRGIKKYGYGKPLAGVTPRIREVVSDNQMEEMGFWYIAAPHDPIKDSDGAPFVLLSDRHDDGRWLYAYFGPPGHRWVDSGAFAFPVLAS